jgi:integrase
VTAPRVTRRRRRLVPDDVLGRVLRPRPLLVASAAAACRAQRDYVIICMLYDTALGISDIRLLRWPQINEQWKVVVVPGRNGVSRSSVLNARLLEALQELRRRTAAWGFDAGDTPYCFPTSTGLPMSRQALCFAVRKWAEQCGPQEVITPSTLRQTGMAHHARRGRPVLTPAVGA